MVNVEQGEADLTINGKTYRLVVKTAGLAAIQKRLSPAGSIKPLPLVIAELQAAVKAQSLEHLVVFLWAALQKYHKGMSEDDAMNLIDEAGGIGGIDKAFADLAKSMNADPEDVAELVPAGEPAGPRKAQARKR